MPIQKNMITTGIQGHRHAVVAKKKYDTNTKKTNSTEKFITDYTDLHSSEQDNPAIRP